MTSHIENQLLKRKILGNLRHHSITQNLTDFASNDYLGLARASSLTASVQQKWERQVGTLIGLGSTGSRLLTGNSLYAQELENRIAAFHGYPAGLLFNCGYMANVGLLSVIGGNNDILFFDANIHASALDGIRLSPAQAFPFRHNDLEHLEKRLKKSSCHGDRFICVESIYSTDGSIAPLREIVGLAIEYGAYVIVDEAHAVGVRGPGGRGLIAELDLASQIFAQVTTFGKAPGTHGAIVLGSLALMQALINFATSYIYTTALPFHSLAAIQSSYDLFPQLEKEREHIRRLIQIFRASQPCSSLTQIQSVPVKGNEKVKLAALNLSAQGFDVRPLMSPTVQRGHEALRICLHAFNTESELRTLLELIESFK